MRIIVLLLAFFALTFHALADENYLTANDIEQLLISKTARWTHFVPMHGVDLTVYLAPRGSMIGVLDNGSLLNTNYWISHKRNQLCFGAGACMFVRDDGNDDYALTSGYPGDNEAVVVHLSNPLPGDVNSLYGRLKKQQQHLFGRQLAESAFTLLLLAEIANRLGEPFSGPSPSQDECVDGRGIDQCKLNDDLIRQANRNREQRQGQ